MKHVPDLYVIDEDAPWDSDNAASLKHQAMECYAGCPWTKSRKGKHFYVFIENVPKLTGSTLDVFEDFEGDFLGTSGNNVWEEVIQPVQDGPPDVMAEAFKDRPNIVYGFTTVEDIPRWD